MTRVKVCGVRDRAGCAAITTAGGNAIHLIGFNFWPHSKRYVDPAVAAELADGLPPGIETVGLFVDPTGAEVRHALQAFDGLDVLQFHGDESPAFCRSFGRRFIKAFRLSDAAVIAGIGDYLDSPDDRFLVDAFVPGEPGGTGHLVRLDLARRAREETAGEMILAGGLTPENVGAAIAATTPWAVDVASGVESAPGIKDASKIAAFAIAVRCARTNHARAVPNDSL